MRKRFFLPVLLIAVTLLACRTLSPDGLAAVRRSASVAPIPSATLTAPPAIPSFTPPAQVSPPIPSVTPLPFPTPLPVPVPAPDAPLQVRFHPDGPLYVGDLVSLEIIVPPGNSLFNTRVAVQFDPPDGPALGQAEIERFGIGGRAQATLEWVWDTASLTPGDQHLQFSVVPGGPTWTVTVRLLPSEAAPNRTAHWAETKSACCIIRYITGTAAERDLPELIKMADEQAADAAKKMNIAVNEPIPITFLPRLLGHGGFTSNEIAVSYLDRNYAAGDVALVLHHEIIHLLDGRLGGDLKPTMLVEGLAVYQTGGHFKPEPIMPRAAALLPPDVGCVEAVANVPAPIMLSGAEHQRNETSGRPSLRPLAGAQGDGQVRLSAAKHLVPQRVPSASSTACTIGRYIPLRELAESFYASQHEIGYLEGAALIEYLTRQGGYDKFNTFYRDLHSRAGSTQAEALDAGLRKHYDLGLDELESRFIAALRAEPITAAHIDDVRLTVAFYDVVRRYQQALDPSAYFATAWLPDPETMRKRSIVADFIRRPDRLENQALEALLNAGGQALQGGDYARVELIVQAVNDALDRLPQGLNAAFPAGTLVGDALRAARAVQAAGFTLQKLELTAGGGRAWGSTAAGPKLTELKLTRVGQEFTTSQ
jgi:hypothetical protein